MQSTGIIEPLCISLDSKGKLAGTCSVESCVGAIWLDAVA
jgi:hypothetical protein